MFYLNPALICCSLTLLQFLYPVCCLVHKKLNAQTYHRTQRTPKIISVLLLSYVSFQYVLQPFKSKYLIYQFYVYIFFFKILSKIIQVSSQNLQNFYLIMSKYVVLYTYRMINCVQSSMEVYFPTRAPLKPKMMCLLMYNQIGFLPYSRTAEAAHGAAHKKSMKP